MSEGTVMKKESIESLRARLLADSQVHSMIEMRAYEIYKLRGGAPGLEAEDWMQAESEILTFLIEEEARRSETEALVARSIARGLGEAVAPIQTDLQTGEAAQKGQPARSDARTTELASPLGLAEFLTDRSPDPEPDRGRPSKSTPRPALRKPPVLRKATGDKEQKARSSSKKASSKETGEKKSGKKPKKS
jgi:hypothetical protein